MSDSRKFHLAWFLSFRPPVWNSPWAGEGGTSWADGSYYVDIAEKLERAKFDYIMVEDTSKVPDAFGGSSEADMAFATVAPKHDPALLIPLMAQRTNRLGLVATMSTSFYPPYLLARSVATMDHISHGRAGWNVVTSSGDRGAQNFGHDELWEHDLRYERAGEFVELVEKLWDSVEPDALVMDRERHVYVDSEKVHVLNFEGTFFKSRGPLNTLPAPQGRPVISQAGGSPAGRDLAAKYADTILSAASGVADMKEYRNDIRRRMESFGRDPDSCKILFVVEPIIGATEAEAEAKRERRMNPSDRDIKGALVLLSSHTEIDFSTFDLDAELPELSTNGHQSSLASLYKMGRTLREAAGVWSHHYVNPFFIGTPDVVAERMGEVMDEVGGDGFIFNAPLTQHYVDEIVDGLVPELQRRGLTRSEYEHEQFRDNLLAF